MACCSEQAKGSPVDGHWGRFDQPLNSLTSPPYPDMFRPCRRPSIRSGQLTSCTTGRMPMSSGSTSRCATNGYSSIAGPALKGSGLRHAVDVVLQSRPPEYSLGWVHRKATSGHGCVTVLLLRTLEIGGYRMSHFQGRHVRYAI